MRRNQHDSEDSSRAAVPRADAVALVVAVLAVCMTGPVIAHSTVPALSMATWRCVIGALLIGAVTAATAAGRTQWRTLRRADTVGMWWAGVFLAAHFATWVPSIRLTTVASSTALVATQPVWAALLARRAGQTISRRMWAGIAVALTGAVVLAGADFAVASARALLGDALALAGAMLAAAYVTAGERVRSRVSTGVYSTVVYCFASVLLAAVSTLAGNRLSGWAASGWWSVAALTFFGQILGHTLINRVVLTVSATVTSTAILFEMPGSTLVAAVWLRQRPPVAVWPALALVLVGLALVVRAHTTRDR